MMKHTPRLIDAFAHACARTVHRERPGHNPFPNVTTFLG